MELSHGPLEAELTAIAEHAGPGRTARLAVRHWGWDGRGACPPNVTELVHSRSGLRGRSDGDRSAVPATAGVDVPRPGDLMAFRPVRRR